MEYVVIRNVWTSKERKTRELVIIIIIGYYAMQYFARNDRHCEENPVRWKMSLEKYVCLVRISEFLPRKSKRREITSVT